jgi:alpha-glucuronidase
LSYDRGVREAGEMKEQWERIEGRVDPERYKVVHDKLLRQAEDAKVWREQSLAYFRRFSGRPIP